VSSGFLNATACGMYIYHKSSNPSTTTCVKSANDPSHWREPNLQRT